MDEKNRFSGKQVLVMVLVIVASIAFIETSHPIWAIEFWKEYLIKIIIYGAVVEFAVILFGNYINRK